jgi:putative restriction endonuclease
MRDDLWSREEFLIVLDLYYKLESPHMRAKTEAIKEVADLIDRSVASVKYRLGNFKSLDPKAKNSGEVGFSHGGPKAKAIWNEFYGKSDLLTIELEEIGLLNRHVERETWRRDELILALELYHRFHSDKNLVKIDEIRRVANIVGRTEGAVQRKISNLQYLDPHEKGGSPNGGKLDGVVWNEFDNDYKSLISECDRIVSYLGGTSGETIIDMGCDVDVGNFPQGLDAIAFGKIRIGQSQFRKEVLLTYGGRCCITSISSPKLLIASHIKPWRDSTPEERVNPNNGLCLNALHDRAFDSGLITVTKDYHIVFSDSLKETISLDSFKKHFQDYEGELIHYSEDCPPSKDMLRYHNAVVFIDDLI